MNNERSAAGTAGFSISSTDADKDLFSQGMDYGGVMQLLQAVRSEFGVDVAAEDFLAEPTLNRLRSLVGEKRRTRQPTPEPAGAAPRQSESEFLQSLLKEAEIEQRIVLDGDLFEQGLTSLVVLRLLGKARSRTGVVISLDEFLARPTMRHLAELIAATGAAPAATPTVADELPPPADSSSSNPRERPGLLCGEAEKQQFVAAGHNLRRLDEAAALFTGILPTPTEFAAEYARRKSQRSFAPKAVTLEQLLGWLGCLHGSALDGKPRYRYPSAGSTYAVQVYVEVKESAVTGLARGMYYYHPLRHALSQVAAEPLTSSSHFFYNRPTYQSAGFCLHFVAEHQGIAPLYGPQSERFIFIEAGCMAQLLMERQVHYNLGGCLLSGMDETLLRQSLQLADSQQVVLAMACGALAARLSADDPELLSGDALAPRRNPGPQVSPPSRNAVGDIAIVGLQGRFPGARDLRQFWRNLNEQQVSISPLPAERLAPGSPADAVAAAGFGGFLDDVYHFDPAFFGISPAEAERMDPQERLLLQSVYELMESSGYCGQNRQRLTLEVGVFVGVMWNDARSVADELGLQGLTIGHTPLSSIANRVSHFFDWIGPSLAIDASCSSALAAVCLACESLRQGRCRAAVVGGVNLLTHPSHVENLRRFGLLSGGPVSDTFGDQASGWLPGEGVGALLLKPLAQAQADQDHIWGVIQSGTLMSSGRVAKYGSPSPERQSILMKRTLADAGVEPDAVQYVEAAAAGSAIGDASEIQALQRVFPARRTPLFVGTVKPNIGHLESASGISQLAKVLLQLQHRRLAPVVPWQKLNPLIRLETGALQIVSQARDWEVGAGMPRRALINSFGGTGSYASVLLASHDEPPAAAPAPADAEDASVFVLSAQTPEQLREYAYRWIEFLKERQQETAPLSLRALTATLQTGRDFFAERLAIVATELPALCGVLSKFLRGESCPTLFIGSAPPPRVPVAPHIHCPSSPAQKAQAWVQGEWSGWAPATRWTKLPLPTYPFKRQVLRSAAVAARVAAAPTAVELPASVATPPVLPRPTQRFEQYILQSAADQLGVSVDLLADKQTVSFLALGLTSMAMVRMVRDLEELTALTLPPDLLVRQGNIVALAGHLRSLCPVLPPRRDAGDRVAATAATPPQVVRFPLSEGQRGLWALHGLNPTMSAYNCPVCFRFSGALTATAVKEACDALMLQYPILGTALHEEDGIPMQTSGVYQRAAICEDDIAGLTAEQVMAYLRDKARVPFSLDGGALFRVHILHRAPQEMLVLFTIHHIIFDGSSFLPLRDRFLHLCRQLAQGQQVELQSLDPSFADFVAAEQSMLLGAEGARRLAYWKQELTGTLPALELYRERSGPATATRRRGTLTCGFSRELCERLKLFALAHSTSQATILLAVFNALLLRQARQDDLVVGMAVDSRSGSRQDPTIGFCVNMVPIRSTLAGDPSFADFLGQVQKRVLSGLAHSYPFPALVRELRVAAGARSPVFQAAYVYQGDIGAASSTQLPESAVGAFTVTALEEIFQEGDYELALEIFARPQGSSLRLSYYAETYDTVSMSQFTEHYVRLLEAVVHDAGRPLSKYELLSVAERHQLLMEWNSTKVEYPSGACIHGVFEAQARQTPDAVALVFDGQQLTYRELDMRANQLAHYLQKHGVQPDTLVGICVERSLEMVIGLLGILKAGGAYVPIDPAYPQARIEFLLADMNAKVLLVQKEFQAKLPAIAATVLCLQADWAQVSREPTAPVLAAVGPQHLAYVIYTSGSTGKPKGCMLSHAAVCNRLYWMQDSYQLSARDRVLQKTPFGFDVSVWEFFWPLMYGATLMLALPGRHTDPAYLIAFIAAQKISICHFVPSMLRTFLSELQAGQCPSLRLVFASGEALTYPLFEEAHAKLGAELHNLYGPTEAAVDVTYYKACRRPDRRIPIGRPIANCQLYVLNGNLELVPVGTPGELHIGGAGLARGYLNRPELTAQKFIANPHAPETSPRLYKTGDLARWLPDGSIEYLGRIDHQVKIRGFRIELGEIETRLLEHEQIRAGVVVPEADGADDRCLVAYLVFRGGSIPSIAALRSFVGAALPEYMVPAKFVALKELPLNASGKVDRAALGKGQEVLEPEQKYIAPQTEVELILEKLWHELLVCKRVGRRDNFFQLGGHSLKVAKLVIQVEKRFGRRIDPFDFYKDPTLQGLADLLALPAHREHELLPQLLKSRGPTALSLICCPYAGAQATVYQPLVEQLAVLDDRVSVYAVAPPVAPDAKEMVSIASLAAASVEQIFKRVTGPVAVYGHCTGSFLALEIARLLEEKGQVVKVLFVGGAFPFHRAARLLPVNDPWKYFSDQRLHNLMKSWGARKDEIDPSTLQELAQRFRRDARLAFVYEKNRKLWKLKAPIVSIVSEDDSLTKHYLSKYRRWEKVSAQVRLFVLKHGGHYFVGERAAAVAKIVHYIKKHHSTLFTDTEAVVKWD